MLWQCNTTSQLVNAEKRREIKFYHGLKEDRGTCYNNLYKQKKGHILPVKRARQPKKKLILNGCKVYGKNRKNVLKGLLERSFQALQDCILTLCKLQLAKISRVVLKAALSPQRLSSVMITTLKLWNIKIRKNFASDGFCKFCSFERWSLPCAW